MPTSLDEQTVEIEAIPWSELGPTFIESWGNSRGKLQAEHIEITGQNGSGKSYTLCTICQERAQIRGTSVVIIVTKPDDDSIPRLGWPIVDTWEDVCKYRWCVFWPRTTAVGEERQRFHEEKIYDLLSNLWQPNAHTVVAFDEILYIESLSDRLRKLIRMMWREARAQDIPMIAMAQRPLGMAREQHSETAWKIVFPPADEDDMKRFAQLLGNPKLWAPVLEELTQEHHEFVIRNTITKQAFVSWIDLELKSLPAQRDQDATERVPPYNPRSKSHG